MPVREAVIGDRPAIRDILRETRVVLNAFWPDALPPNSHLNLTYIGELQNASRVIVFEEAGVVQAMQAYQVRPLMLPNQDAREGAQCLLWATRTGIGRARFRQYSKALFKQAFETAERRGIYIWGIFSNPSPPLIEEFVTNMASAAPIAFFTPKPGFRIFYATVNDADAGLGGVI